MDIVIDYTPHEKQRPFHESKAKFRLLSTGAGFGKTAAGVNELIRECMNAGKKQTLVMVAPTYKMLQNVTIREFTKFCPPQLIQNYNKVEQRFMFINGVELLGIAGDRQDTIDKIRGLTIAGAYGDEIALCPEYMHEMLIERLREGNMRLWYTTTPKGYNWLYRLFIEKKNKDNKPLPNPEDYEIFYGTSMDNPYTPDNYKETLKNTFVGVFAKQEIYGEFVGFEGLVYTEFRRDLHVIDTSKIEFKEIVAGIDWGWTNPTAVAVIGFDYDDRAYVIDEYYQDKTTAEELARIVKEEFPNASRFIADSASPESIEILRRAGLNCKGVSKKPGEKDESFIRSGIEKVAGRLIKQEDGKARLYVDKKCIHTIKEFEMYRYPEKKDDKPEQEKPEKGFDHLMDAIRYVLEERRHKLEFGFV